MCCYFYTKPLSKTKEPTTTVLKEGHLTFKSNDSVGHLDTVHFTTKAVVLTISVRINFRENLIATFISYDRKMKLHVIQKRQVI